MAPKFGKKLAAFLFWVGFNVAFYLWTTNNGAKKEDVSTS